MLIKTEILQEMKSVDASERTIHSDDLVSFVCHLCDNIGEKRFSEARRTLKKHGFAYQCESCLKKKYTNRGEAWRSNVKKAAQTEAHKQRARDNSKAHCLKYTTPQIERVLAEAGVAYEGDLSSPSNTIKIIWPDGVTRSIRIRRFMKGGLVRPKTGDANPNHLRFTDTLTRLGLTVKELGGDRATITYKGVEWDQGWPANHVDKKCHRKIKNIDNGLKLQALLDQGVPLNKACKEVGVDPNRYYRNRRSGIGIMDTALATKDFSQLIRIDGAIYNLQLAGTSYRPGILVPELNLIIETDGMLWHSEQYKEKSYHATRWCKFNEMGYNVLSFSEFEVKEKRHIVDSMIGHKQGKSLKLYANECDVVVIGSQDAKAFFEANHMKGSGSGVCLGLQKDGVVYCAIRYTDEKTHINISRFSNLCGHTVVGGYSKLLNRLPKDKDIVNFVDRRHGTGENLLQFGFVKTKVHIGFEWTDGYLNFNRRSFLGNAGYEKGLKKFWDYGQVKYVKKAIE